MKATGVIRRIDDLGRIVIPKEIRRNLKINDGDNVEIYVSDDSIILKKFCFLSSSIMLAKIIADTFYKIYHRKILITDNEKVIAGDNNFIDKILSTSVVEILKKRCDSENNTSIINGYDNINFFLYPLISNGDLLGSILLLGDNISDYEKSIIKLISAILIKNVEE